MTARPLYECYSKRRRRVPERTPGSQASTRSGSSRHCRTAFRAVLAAAWQQDVRYLL